MSRTSSLQIEVMIDFMERNGDLNKFADGPNDRIFAINRRQEVANILNLDTTITSKPVDEWNKVWTDFKKNTKRKASKIHRAASGTGGGPACKLVLIDLEEQVLSIIGSQAATGLANVEEFGLEGEMLQNLRVAVTSSHAFGSVNYTMNTISDTSTLAGEPRCIRTCQGIRTEVLDKWSKRPQPDVQKEWYKNIMFN